MSKMLRRVLTVIPAAAVQALWILLLVKWLSPYAAYITLALSVAAVLLVLFIIIKRDETAYKILWLLVILTVPVAGALLYLLFGNRRTARPLRKRLRRVQEAGQPAPLPCGGTPFEGEKRMEQTVRWLEHKTGYPLMRAEDVRYYPLGDAMYPDMLTDLRAAKKTIYLEYFIIEPGEMWQSIVDILAQKVREGLDVRVMYDDLGSISTFNFSNALALEKLGIRCATFNPLLALKGTANYRDHRKILVIDGKVGFTGGVNLADEYINHIEKYGCWKDAAVMLEGEGVRTLTILFLEMWSIRRESEFDKFLSAPPYSVPAKGFAAPYGDCPLDGERVGEMVYIDLLNRAKRYIHIMTPYLILDGELETALKFAAERGVDVHLILPHVPDKKFAYALAKTHYASLLDSGVRISEWLPGFVHAKVFVVDDCEAVVGTINLDYRSLYHHFEDAVWMKDTACISAIEKDFQKTLEFCRDVEPTRESIWEGKTLLHLAGVLLKVIAPLL